MSESVETAKKRLKMISMLRHAKEKPVHCAIGVGKDKVSGLLLMDLLTQPRALEKELIAANPGAWNTRWGTARVDLEDDPKLVKLYLNKPVSSMARRLVKTLRGTGFSRVQIMMEDGTPVEGAADEEEVPAAAAAGASDDVAPAVSTEGAEPPPAPPLPEQAIPTHDAADLTRRLASLAPRIPQVAGDDATRREALLRLARLGQVNLSTNNLVYAATYIEQLARALEGGLASASTAQAPAQASDGAEAPPPPPPPLPEEAAPAHDAADLAKRLAVLAPRIPQVAGNDAERREALLKLAKLVNVNLKTNNLVYAATYLEQLASALDAKASSPEMAATAGAVAYGKSRLAWLATRRKMTADIDRLRAEIVATYADEPDVAQLEQRYGAVVAPLLDTLDESLADKLDEATNAADPALRQVLVGEAKAIIARYQSVLASEKVIADLDRNPFVPLSIQQTMTTTLTALAAAVR